MSDNQTSIVRVQTGVRLEKRILKVLKALAAEKEMGLGDLVEGIVLHAFEGKRAFGDDSLRLIARLREAYGLTLTADDSHQFEEQEAR